MSIHFSSLIPWWGAIALFMVISAASLWAYGRASLTRPWSILLPCLRIATVAVLVLMLKQPRLVKEESREERGKVAILVDNSGSMSVSDDYSLSRQVELASRLKLFDSSLRCSEFAGEAQRLETVEANLQRIIRRLQTLSQAVARKNSSVVKQSTQEIDDYLSQSQEALREMPERLVNSLDVFEYLKVSDTGKAILRTKDSRARGLSYKRWEDVPGNTVKNLLESPVFAGPPTETRLVPNFEAPQNMGQQAGTVLAGYVHPPISGNYVFHIASDDQGILYLSSDTSPKKKQELCRAPAWTSYRKFDAYPEQRSKPIRLQAHKLYYVEAVMKEMTGLDHLTVRWTRPDGRIESPIPGEYLTPFGVDTTEYFGPDFDRLHPRIVKKTRELFSRLDRLGITMSEQLSKGDSALTERAFGPIAQRINSLTARIDSLRRRMITLQESADMRLAYAGLRPVNNGLLRLRQMNRADLAREILTGDAYNLLSKLEPLAEPKLFVLGEEARHVSLPELPVLRNRLSKTDLARNVRDVLKYFENQFLAGVIVLSDGNDNSGSDLREIRRIAKNQGVPLVCLGVGSTQPPKDVAIEGVAAPENSFKNDEITVKVVLKRDGFTGETIPVTIMSDGLTLCTTRVVPGLESRVSVNLSFVETRDGPLEYTVQAQGFPSEQVADNNRRTFKVNILKDPIRVLVLDSFPRWETRFLTMMMERDKRFRVKPVYCGMDAGDVPKPLELDDSLLEYDLFILGDVDPGRFTGDQFETVRTFVSERQGTILFLSGRNHMPSRYVNSPLADLIPVRSLQTPVTQLDERTPIQPAMTMESSFDAMVRIASTPEITRKLWTGLPALDWAASGVIASRTAETLVSVQSTEVPILIRQDLSGGTVIYVGSDSFWRWRDQARWRYYHRFWGQLLLWASFDRSGTSNPFVKVMTDRPEYRPADAIEVTVRILNADGVPLNQARATLDVYDQTTDKAVKIVQLQYVEKSDGKYLAVLKGLPFGKYRATVHIPALQELEKGAEVRFEVRNLPSTEYTELTLNPSALQSMGTHYLPLENADRVPELIPEVRIPRTFTHEWEMWNTFPALAFVAVLLGLEWYLRKRQRLA